MKHSPTEKLRKDSRCSQMKMRASVIFTLPTRNTKGSSSDQKERTIVTNLNPHAKVRSTNDRM